MGVRRRTRRGGGMRLAAGLAACLLALGACASVGGGRDSERDGDEDADAPVREVDPEPAAKAPVQRPNIVLVLMDDFSRDLVQTLRSARVMERRGASYSHAFVVDSLCCVSRASLLTGQYPHQTGVRTNSAGVLPSAPLGGWAAFDAYGNAERSVNVALQQAGYTTGFVGKYLNEYEYTPGREVPPLPPGWTQFRAVFGSAYDGWDFHSTAVGPGGLELRHHPAPPATAPARAKDEAYAGRVISDLALDFVRERERDDAPYFLEVAPYAPHSRTNPEPHYPGDPLFPPMFRDRPSAKRPHGNCGAVSCTSLTAEDLPGLGDDRGDNHPLLGDGGPARAWNTGETSLETSHYVRDLRDRARMAQSVDRMVLELLRLVGDDTYVVLTSDNGFHLGQSGLARGKGTAYDTDVRVPLYVVGPGVVPGERDQLTSNLDLAPTFEELAGLRPRRYRSGLSLVDSLTDPGARGRDHVFVEHTGQALTRLDPDSAFTGGELDRIPSYVAVRSRDALLVRHDLDPAVDVDSRAYEFYSYADAPWERRNAFADPRHRREVRELLGALVEYDACAGLSGDDPVPARCRGGAGRTAGGTAAGTAGGRHTG